VDKGKIHWVNWKKTCKQKNLGGMGFRELGAFNEALLAKQGWRITTAPTSLMAQVLKAKYFPKTSFLHAKQGNRASYSWQSIQQASWILKRGWYWTPKPPDSSLDKVHDLINPITNWWNTQIINQTFLPIEAAQITQIPLDTSNREDILCWQGTKDGYYTVKSGYHAQVEWNDQQTHQAQTSNPLREEQTWKRLWKIDAPPKQIHLLWRIIHDALPVKTNLLHKGILCDTLCPRCTKPMETINCTFLTCDWAKMIWYNSPISIKTT
jgi:hypothetical protein